MSAELKIFVDEEYGYRTWIWTYPGTFDQLRIDWEKGNCPFASKGIGYLGRPKSDTYEEGSSYNSGNHGCTDSFIGTIERANTDLCSLDDGYDDFAHSFDAYMHIHDIDDSYMRIGIMTTPWTAHCVFPQPEPNIVSSTKYSMVVEKTSLTAVRNIAFQLGLVVFMLGLVVMLIPRGMTDIRLALILIQGVLFGAQLYYFFRKRKNY